MASKAKIIIVLILNLWTSANCQLEDHTKVASALDLCEDTTSTAASIKQYEEQTGVTGVINSPCWDGVDASGNVIGQYGEEYTEGLKVNYININTAASVLGIQFTIVKVSLLEDHILYFSGTLDGREYKMIGDAAASTVQVIEINGAVETVRFSGLSEEGSFYLQGISHPLFAKPYSARTQTDDLTGYYSFTYRADLNICPDAETTACSAKNGASCTRSGQFTYQCVCTNNWSGENCNVDRDECILNLDNCDDISTDCDNQPGTFRCTCKTGFENLNAAGTTCTEITCIALAKPVNGNSSCVEGTSYGFSQDCSYTCNEGFKLTTGQSLITCTESGWTNTEAHTCTPITCQKLDFANSTASTCSADATYSYDATCTLSCNPGFNFVGTANIVCNGVEGSVSGWSFEDQSCSSITCIGLVSPNNGVSSCLPSSASSPFSFRTSCTVECNPGYELTEGTSTTSCVGASSNNGYNGAVHICSAIQCTAWNPNPPNTISTCGIGGPFIFNFACTISCQSGYLFAGTSSITCSGAATANRWSAQDQTCTDINECADGTSRCSNGACEDLDGSWQCSCNVGFTLEPVLKQSCLPITCGALISPNQGTISCTTDTTAPFNYNTVCTVSCNSGYNLVGVTSYTCDGSTTNNWSSLTVTTCTPIVCNGLAIPTNGQSTTACVAGTTYSFGHECEYECNDGFQLNAGAALIECTATGWSDATVHICGDINECTSGADISSCTNGICENTVGSWKCNCNTGFTVDTTTNQACLPIQCTGRGDPQFGSINGCTEGATLNFGTSCTVTCDGGYVLTAGTSTITCGIGVGVVGFWSSLNLVCSPIQCTGLQVPSNGQSSCTESTQYMFNHACTYTCNAGYDLTAGSSSITCGGTTTSGTWSNPTIPVCSDVNECDDKTLNTCVAPASTCENLMGGFRCICNDPLYRTNAAECDYYCPEDSTCSSTELIGYLKEHYTAQFYVANKDTYWIMNDIGGVLGWKFTIITMNTQKGQDFLIFGKGNDPEDESVYTVKLSGSPDDLLDFENEAADKEDDFYKFTKETMTVISKTHEDIFVRFTSDPNKDEDREGIWIRYEADGVDCPDVSPCTGGSTCMELAFDYMCSPCPDGYGGKHCDEDIDECTEGVGGDSTKKACVENAVCTNANGSYSCACANGYITSNTSAARPTLCRPHLVLTLPVASAVTSTSATISYYFAFWQDKDITPYVFDFKITYNGNETTTTSQSIDLTGLTPATTYTLKVEVNSAGISIGDAVVDVASGTITFNTADIAPLQMNQPSVIGLNRRAEVTWEQPNETGIGVTTAYRIMYVCADCSNYPNFQNGDEQAMVFMVDQNDRNYTLTGLHPYRTYNISVAAQTSAGWGPYSDITVAVSGTTNDGTTYDETLTQETDLQTRITSNNYPNNYENTDASGTQFRYWKYFLSNECKGTKLDLIYFNTQLNEDILYAGQIDDGQDVRIFDTYTSNTYLKFSLSGLPANDERVMTRDTPLTTADDRSYFVFHPDQSVTAPGFEIEVVLDCDACTAAPNCLNGGVCTDGTYSYECNCDATDYQGPACQYPKVVVSSFACVTTARTATCTWDEPARWTNDETVVMSYTVTNGDGVSKTMNFNRIKAITIDGLEPYTDYEFQLSVAYTSQFDFAGLSTPMSEVAPEKTKQDVPEAPVTNIQLITITDSSVTVSFTPSVKPNGIVSYDFSSDGMLLRSDVTQHENVVITGLTPYTDYNLMVTVKTIIGGLAADPVTFKSNSAVPTTINGVTVDATTITATQFEVCWTLVPGVVYPGPTTYTVTVADVAGVASTVVVTSTVDASCTMVTGLEEGRQFTVSVQASTAAGSGTTTSGIPAFTAEAAPGLMSSLTRNSATENQILIGFTPPTELEKNGVILGYTLTHTNDAGTVIEVFPAADDTSYTITGLTLYTKYTVTISARNGAGNGEVTTREFYTADGVPGAATFISPEIGDTHITFKWTAPVPIVGSYIYVYKFNNGATLTTTDTSIQFTDLTPATNYPFEVTVQTAQDNNQGPLQSTSVTTSDGKPENVENLVRTSGTTVTITLEWDSPTVTNGVITLYKVSWIVDSEENSATTLPGVLTYTITGLSPEKDYNVSVQASTSKDIGDKETVTMSTEEGFLSAVTFTAAFVEGNVVFTITPGADVPGVTFANYYVLYSEDNARCTAAKDDACTVNAKSETFTDVPFLYSLSSLKPWRLYNFQVFVVSGFNREIGSAVVVLETPVEVPPPAENLAVGSITETSGQLTWEAATPLTGPTTYSVIVAGTSINREASSPDDLTGLGPGITYTVTIRSSVTGNDESGSETTLMKDSSTTFKTTETVPAEPKPPSAGNSNATTISISWTEPSPPNGVIAAYEITITCITTPAPAVCGDKQTKTVGGDQLSSSITGLQPATQYTVTVTAVNSAGNSVSESITMTTAAGELTIVDGAAPTIPLTIGGTTFTLDNPCNNLSALFDQSQGVVTSVAIQLVEVGGTERSLPEVLNIFWITAYQSNPSEEYTSFNVGCSASSRKRRSVSEDGEKVTLGDEDGCEDKGSQVCNGKLKAGTEYKLAFTGENAAGNKAKTGYSDTFKTASNKGLTAGEIAAIVICSILFVILVIILLFICWRRKNKTGKKTISTKRSKHYDNVGYDDSAKTQKYEVDPAADPPTAYSTNTPQSGPESGI